MRIEYTLLSLSFFGQLFEILSGLFILVIILLIIHTIIKYLYLTFKNRKP